MRCRPADSYTCERARQPRRVRMRMVRKPGPRHSPALPTRLRPPMAARAGLHCALAGCIVVNPMYCFSTGAGDSADQGGVPSRYFVAFAIDTTLGVALAVGLHTLACQLCQQRAAALPASPRASWYRKVADCGSYGAPCGGAPARARRDARLAAFPLGSSNDTPCALLRLQRCSRSWLSAYVKVLGSQLQQGVRACCQGPGEWHPRAQGPRRSGSALRCSWWSGPPAWWSRAFCAARWYAHPSGTFQACSPPAAFAEKTPPHVRSA